MNTILLISLLIGLNDMPQKKSLLQQAYETVEPEKEIPKVSKDTKKKKITRWSSLLGGAGLDIASTHHALGKEGLVEGNNKVYGSNPSLERMIGTKLASIVGSGLLLDKLAKESPKLSTGMGIGFGLLQSLVGLRNYKLASGRKDR